jgi:uncharacterized protein YndB with AHSA1/START domain
MATQEIDVQATAEAPPEAVWRLLADSTVWPTWTPIDRIDVLEAGDAQGVGEMRMVHNGRFHIREQIVEKRAGERLTYTVEDGLPLRGYRAEIDVAPAGDGRTSIRWHTTFDAKIPGTGPLYRWALAKATQQFVSGLTERARAAA